MAYKVEIKGDALVELLESHLGNVFEHIKEDDRITKIKLHYGDNVEIIIGDEDEDKEVKEQ